MCRTFFSILLVFCIKYTKPHQVYQSGVALFYTYTIFSIYVIVTYYKKLFFSVLKGIVDILYTVYLSYLYLILMPCSDIAVCNI